MSRSHPLWIIPVKLLTTPSRSGHTVLAWPSLHGKAIKPFFSTSPKTSRFNSVARFGISLSLPHNLHPLNSLLFKGGEGITLWICLLNLVLCLSNKNIRQLQASLWDLKRPALSPFVLFPLVHPPVQWALSLLPTLHLSCPALYPRVLTFTGHQHPAGLLVQVQRTERGENWVLYLCSLPCSSPGCAFIPFSLKPLVAQTVKHLSTMRETRFDPWVGKIPWRRKWQSTPGLVPGKSHGQRSLVGYSPWGRKESDTTERLHFFPQTPVIKLWLFYHWATWEALCPQIRDLLSGPGTPGCSQTPFKESMSSKWFS